MNSYAVADDAGFITQIYQSTSRFVACGDDATDLTHYVTSENKVVPKSGLEYDMTTNCLTVTFTDLPAGLNVQANGIQAATDDEPLEIQFDLPGSYIVSFSGLPEYLDTDVTVEVEVPEEPDGDT